MMLMLQHFLRGDYHFVPHITLAPYNGFFQEKSAFGRKKITVGRNPEGEVALGSEVFAYHSRVVSRTHAEIWFSHGSYYIRDTRSTSGTFLNAMRLSEPGKESRPFKIVTGDVVQFGVDLRRGHHDDERGVSTMIIVRKIPVSLRKLCIQVVRRNWHKYSDKDLEKVPLNLEKEILKVYSF